MQISIRHLHADVYAISPAQFLGKIEFQRYQRAIGISFTEYDPDARCYRTKLKSLPAIVDRMRADGFLPMANPEVQQAIASARVTREKARGEAVSRANAADAELRMRGLSLYPFQFEGVDFLAARDAALLGDQMGLGKTVQALLALPRGARVLVVCPAVVKGVWAAEIQRFRPDFRVGFASRDMVVPNEGEILITSYNLLPEPIDRLEGDFVARVWAGEPLPKMVLLADEAHALKSPKSRRTIAFRALSHEVRKRGGKVWLLTATPLLGRPQELWGVLSAAGLQRGAFGSWENFLLMYRAKKTPWGKGYFWGKPTPDVLKGFERVSLRRHRADVLPELPEKVYRRVEVPIDRVQFRNELDGSLSRWENPNELPPFDMLAQARGKLAEHKTQAMLDLVDDYLEQEEPLVVFSAHRFPIEALRQKGHPVITGDESHEERSKLVSEFQAGWSVKRGKHYVIGATIGAGGVGITLTRAAHTLFVDRDFTPAMNDQAEDRICRIGQDRGVVVTLLFANHPLDRRLDAILGSKREMIEASLGVARTG